MGMAASQARLLALTARIHDIEYQSQSIQNAKMQLATKSDNVYREYMDALDAQTVTLRIIDNGEKSTVAATFNNLCSKNRLTPVSPNTTYALRDMRGRLIVDDEIADGYQKYMSAGSSPTAQGFAMFMMCGVGGALGNVKDVDTTLQDAELSAWEKMVAEGSTCAPSTELQNLHEKLVNLTANDIYNRTEVDESNLEEYDKTLKEYREKLYSEESYISMIMDELQVDFVDEALLDPADETQMADFRYYESMFNQIQANGGLCIGISKFDGFDGDAANDSEWLTAMIQCGQITVELVKKDKDGEITFEGTLPSSDTSLRYEETTSIDSTAAKKAEAKYEHDLKEIEQKDKKFDLTLSKLETEHTALTTEYESVKKVIEDNIGRTFKIFS